MVRVRVGLGLLLGLELSHCLVGSFRLRSRSRLRSLERGCALAGRMLHAPGRHAAPLPGTLTGPWTRSKTLGRCTTQTLCTWDSFSCGLCEAARHSWSTKTVQGRVQAGFTSTRRTTLGSSTPCDRACSSRATALRLRDTILTPFRQQYSSE